MNPVTSYQVSDDLESVYASLLEPHAVNDEVIENHYRVNGKLRLAVIDRLGVTAENPGYVYLLVSGYFADNTVQVEVGYGPGEVDLTFVPAFDVPHDRSTADSLLYWLAGLE